MGRHLLLSSLMLLQNLFLCDSKTQGFNLLLAGGQRLLLAPWGPYHSLSFDLLHAFSGSMAACFFKVREKETESTKTESYIM